MTTEKKKKKPFWRRCLRRCCSNGCCGCCKPPVHTQKQVDRLIHVKEHVKEKNTPYGYARLYAGVCTSDNKYTCPMLSLHLHRHSKHHFGTAQNNRTVDVDGKGRASLRDVGQQRFEIAKSSAEEEVVMIPLEDILRISYTSEYTKGIEAAVKTRIDPTYEYRNNCCDKCCVSILKSARDCCPKRNKIASGVQNDLTIINDGIHRATEYKEEELPVPEKERGCWATCFYHCRCWCCREKKLTKLTKKTELIEEQQAQREIVMTIEYNKYSNLDTASHTRLLGNADQLAYYKEKFRSDTDVKFYFDNNRQMDNTNFEEKREQAETICRIVTQLKGMRNRYPSEDELEKILEQPHNKVFGLVYEEPALQLSPSRKPLSIENAQVEQLSSPPLVPLAVHVQRVTVSANDKQRPVYVLRIPRN